MFPKKHRVRKEKKIKKILKNNQRINNKFFSLLYLKNHLGYARGTVIVSKKYDKRAVYRNKLKRKFREAAYHFIIKSSQNLDIIIIPKYNAKNINFHDIKSNLENAFKKITHK